MRPTWVGSPRRRSALGATASLATAIVAATEFWACSSDSLSVEFPLLRIIPQPTPGQEAIYEPPIGIAAGELPLLGRRQATFALENDSHAIVRLHGFEVVESNGAIASATLLGPHHGPPPTAWPVELMPGEVARAVVTVEALRDRGRAEVWVEVAANTGPAARLAHHTMWVAGTGVLRGEPKLEIAYAGLGEWTQLAGCEPAPLGQETRNGQPPCQLPPLDLGIGVPHGRLSQAVTLRNVPDPGQCELPPLPDGSSDCAPVCILRIARDPEGLDIGAGITPAGSGFAIAGNIGLPIEILPASDACGTSGTLRLPITFQASATVGAAAASLHLESNAANLRRAEIPLVAEVRDGPVAVAQLLTCEHAPPGHPCTTRDVIRPLQSVYFDGRESHDPSRPNDGEAIVDYAWEVVELPPAARSSALTISGQGSPLASLWLPTAGRYTVRLRVENDVGLRSAPGPTSDLHFIAIPEQRLQFELSWNNPDNDQDLHIVHVETDPRIYNNKSDCFWLTCLPQACADAADCAAVQWFADAPPFFGPNPRLDTDDTQGLGPEIVHIDEPRPGHYRIYVHYYGLVDRADTPTVATLRIYVDGLLTAEVSRPLSRDDLWAVGEVQWHSGDAGATVTLQPADASGWVGTVTTLPSMPYPNGVYP